MYRISLTEMLSCFWDPPFKLALDVVWLVDGREVDNLVAIGIFDILQEV